ncbi:phage tail sheath family protein [Streptomyces humi]|uniref:phage tail sheath family protein n=1 Tax=Streptomyces humi TaxID=1428620 RepID=UPI0006287965|nr:phage tail sheath C-terminal domain-containing protein [Streptomyces humi]
MAFNIGVNVVETDGTEAPTVTGAAVSVGAFNVLTQRGVPDTPVRVTSFVQFVDRFGSYFAGGLGAYLVKGFFDNGGQTAYVNRVVDPTIAASDAVASRTLPDTGGTSPTLRVEAGFRGQADPGTWGRGLFVRTALSSSASSRLRESAPATVTGAATAATVNMSAPPTLSVKVDGAATATVVTFLGTDFANPAAATRQEIRDAINRQTHLMVASVSGSALVLTSTGERAAVSGGWSGLQVTADATALGFTAMSNPVQGTPVALTAGGTRLARPDGFEAGDALTVTDATTTVRVRLLSVDPASGAVTWAPDLPNPAAFTDLRAVTVANAEFDLTVAQGTGDADHAVETFPALSMEPGAANYAPTVLNNPLSGSRFVRLVDLGTPSPGTDRPAPTGGFLALQGGADGTPTATHFSGDPAARTGFFAFDPFDVQLVCCERTDTAIAQAGLAYCAGRGDAVYVGAVPEGFVAAGQAVAYGQALQTKKAYGALYGPWIVVPDPIGTGTSPQITLPPVGHVLGVYARIEATRGIWKAPAGDEANLLGVLDVETRLSDADHTELVVDGGVNGIRPVPRSGIVVDASRTLSSDPRWRYVNVRLLFNFVESSLRTALRWARQEPNREALWSAVKFGTVTPFLMGLHRLGAFGTGTPEQTFTVTVDATNNPPDQVQQGLLQVRVLFYPSRPAETIVITVGQQAGGATTTEA